MIAASFGGAISNGISPGVVEAGVPKSPVAGIVHAESIKSRNTDVNCRFTTTTLDHCVCKINEPLQRSCKLGKQTTSDKNSAR
jgi:hypothetical protein